MLDVFTISVPTHSEKNYNHTLIKPEKVIVRTNVKLYAYTGRN